MLRRSTILGEKVDLNLSVAVHTTMKESNSETGKVAKIKKMFVKII